MVITKPCGLQGKIFTYQNRKYKVHNFSWNDGMYICGIVGTNMIRYFAPTRFCWHSWRQVMTMKPQKPTTTYSVKILRDGNGNAVKIIKIRG